ncbi:MAG: ATP-binding protein [Acutalibacteraceae bacterium]
MRNSILKRNLCISLCSLAISFIILGSILILVISLNWENSKKYTLSENITKMSELITKYTDVTDGSIKPLYPDILPEVLNNFSDISECELLYSDKEGKITFATSLYDNVYKDKAVSARFLNKIDDNYYEKSDCYGFFDETYLISAKSYIHNGETIGYCFAIIRESDICNVTIPIIITFICSALLSFGLMAIMIFFFSAHSLKPLKEMSEAAKAFAMGDFSSRVSANSYDEVGDLARAFNEMADSLSNSEALRRSFIANVSHELKTPMTTIGGFVDGILDGTIPQEQQFSYLNTVSNEVKRLSRLVTSMLSISRIDSGELKLKKSSFNLTNIVIQTLFSFEQIIENKCLDVRGLDGLDNVVIEADYDLLYQVIYNLFENATKFTPPSGYIEVRISDTPEKVSVSIINSGHGIERKELPLIFDKFYKTDKSRNKDKKGMGLGLYIVKTIMHMHGGDITADSELDKYTDFTFWLPKPQPQQFFDAITGSKT